MGRLIVTRGRKVGCENYGSVESTVTIEDDINLGEANDEAVSQHVKSLQELANRLVEEDLQAQPAVYQGGHTQPQAAPEPQKPQAPQRPTSPAMPSQARAPYPSNTPPPPPTQQTLPMRPPSAPKQYNDFAPIKTARQAYPWIMKMSAHYGVDLKGVMSGYAKEAGQVVNTQSWTDEWAVYISNQVIAYIQQLPNYGGEFDAA